MATRAEREAVAAVARARTEREAAVEAEASFFDEVQDIFKGALQK